MSNVSICAHVMQYGPWSRPSDMIRKNTKTPKEQNVSGMNLSEYHKSSIADFLERYVTCETRTKFASYIYLKCTIVNGGWSRKIVQLSTRD